MASTPSVAPTSVPLRIYMPPCDERRGSYSPASWTGVTRPSSPGNSELRSARGCGLAQRLGRVEHGLAGVGGLEDDGVAGLLEHLAHEPVGPGEGELDDHGAVAERLGHRTLLAGPAGARGGDPHPRAA